jgi:hypothetical protein
MYCVAQLGHLSEDHHDFVAGQNLLENLAADL